MVIIENSEDDGNNPGMDRYNDKEMGGVERSVRNHIQLVR